MPQYQSPPLGVTRAALIAICAIGLLAAVWTYTWWWPAILVVVALYTYFVDVRWQRRMAASRQQESLCTFARGFECREIDTWIIRAVYEQIHELVKFPIRKSDKLESDLRLDGDDRSELAIEIAFRTGRPLENYEQNPWYDRVETVEDLVSFFRNQPQAAPTCPAPTSSHSS